MTQKAFHGIYRSPLGRLEVAGENGRISRIALVESRRGSAGNIPARVRSSLDAYFSGGPRQPKSFFALHGTPFQKKVWETLGTIPWGSRISYAQLARRVRKPRAIRAVANAVASNPVAILVPCHRVVGWDGRLTGYAYGLKKKSWLLRHEERRRG